LAHLAFPLHFPGPVVLRSKTAGPGLAKGKKVGGEKAKGLTKKLKFYRLGELQAEVLEVGEKALTKVKVFSMLEFVGPYNPTSAITKIPQSVCLLGANGLWDFCY